MVKCPKYIFKWCIFHAAMLVEPECTNCCTPSRKQNGPSLFCSSIPSSEPSSTTVAQIPSSANFCLPHGLGTSWKGWDVPEVTQNSPPSGKLPYAIHIFIYINHSFPIEIASSHDSYSVTMLAWYNDSLGLCKFEVSEDFPNLLPNCITVSHKECIIISCNKWPSISHTSSSSYFNQK